MSSTLEPKSLEFFRKELKEVVDVKGIKELKNGMLQVNLAFRTTELGSFEVRGFRVGPSLQYEGLWVQPPKIPPLYRVEVFRVDPEVWKELSDYLIGVYKEKFPDRDEVVSPDDIPDDLGGRL